MRLAILLLALCVSSFAAERSSVQTRAFKLANPCPSTGERRGSCPGYVIDHIQPLCASGEDHPRNMQWQRIEEAKIKDRDEWRLCRNMKKAGLR